MDQWETAQASPEIVVNGNFETLSHQAVYGNDPAPTTGLIWGYYGGRWGGVAVDSGSLTLTDSSTNYVTVETATGAIGVSTSGTNWASTAYARVYKLTTTSGAVSAIEDHRAGPGGVHGGAGGSGSATPAGIPQNSQSAAYTLVMADANGHMLHPAADTTARTFTLPANASVAYPIGTAVTFVNQHGAGVLTIVCGDTMRLAGTGTTGNRTLAADGIATALKITTTEWIISGAGLS